MSRTSLKRSRRSFPRSNKRASASFRTRAASIRTRRRHALRRKAEEAGIALDIAVVTGDDLMDRADEIRAAGVTEMFSGAALPEKLTTMNAYLGAQPIAVALDRGADVVITGRCVDSAVVLGPMVHAFGWSWTRLRQAGARQSCRPFAGMRGASHRRLVH